MKHFSLEAQFTTWAIHLQQHQHQHQRQCSFKYKMLDVVMPVKQTSVCVTIWINTVDFVHFNSEGTAYTHTLCGKNRFATEKNHRSLHIFIFYFIIRTTMWKKKRWNSPAFMSCRTKWCKYLLRCWRVCVDLSIGKWILFPSYNKWCWSFGFFFVSAFNWMQVKRKLIVI